MAKQPAPNQKKMAIVLSAVLVAITLLTGVLALLQGNPYGKASGSSPVETVLPERGESSSSQGEPTPDSSMSGPDSPSLPEGETDIPSESAKNRSISTFRRRCARCRSPQGGTT